MIEILVNIVKTFNRQYANMETVQLLYRQK